VTPLVRIRYSQLKRLYNDKPTTIFLAMISKVIVTALKYFAVVLLLFAVLFSDGIWSTSSGFMGSCLREILAVSQDAATQWMLLLCLSIYFIIFVILQQRIIDLTPWNGPMRVRGGSRTRIFFLGNLFKPELWLTAMVLLAIFRFALTQDKLSQSIQISTFMTGIVFGKAIATWARWRRDEIERRALFLICSLVCLLAISALWRTQTAMEFQYHGIPRWTGVWDNPNLYGLLMGIGIILSVGFLVLNLRTYSWRLIPIVIVAVLCGFGLIKSYSRGAWLAVLTGLIYLMVQAIQSSRISVWFRRNWLPLALLLASLALLAFWQFRFLELRPAQRMFSVTNANDFSWRNRVTAWEGAVRMMVDRPWVGFGWGQAETVYSKIYCPPRLNEGAAIEMNDYFMIGISVGVPAMFCFVSYLVLSFRGRPAGLNPPFSIFTVCRSGSIVLLVGFWFDGGLFKLATATVFWTFMELSRLESFIPMPIAPVQPAKVDDAKSNMAVLPQHGGWEKRLRWVATILAVLATAQTIVYLGTPLLPVGDETLAVARKCLISQHEIKDFDFLSTNEIWRGQKIKVLLEHVQLANYDRQLINWTLDNEIYQHFVLSPVITGRSDEQLDWRRPFWEEFYPRIRHAASLEEAAKIVFAHLHERVTIATLPNSPREVPEIWSKQITDEAGFEIIFIAALRSVGVPAHLDSNSHAEFWNGNNWQTTPVPSVVSW
jgi:O-antigen ligase